MGRRLRNLGGLGFLRMNSCSMVAGHIVSSSLGLPLGGRSPVEDVGGWSATGPWDALTPPQGLYGLRLPESQAWGTSATGVSSSASGLSKAASGVRNYAKHQHRTADVGRRRNTCLDTIGYPT